MSLTSGEEDLIPKPVKALIMVTADDVVWHFRPDQCDVKVVGGQEYAGDVAGVETYKRNPEGDSWALSAVANGPHKDNLTRMTLFELADYVERLLSLTP